MIALNRAVRHSFSRRFPQSVRFGWAITHQAATKLDVPRLGFGLALMAYGFAKKRNKPRLIYKTSIDVDQGTRIRVMRGRHPIAETAPLP